MNRNNLLRKQKPGLSARPLTPTRRLSRIPSLPGMDSQSMNQHTPRTRVAHDCVLINRLINRLI